MADNEQNRPGDEDAPSEEETNEQQRRLEGHFDLLSANSDKVDITANEDTREDVRKIIEDPEGKADAILILDGKDADTLATSSVEIRTKNMAGVMGTDKGINYKPVNEDRVGINVTAEKFVVTDGVGGYDGGDKAAAIITDRLLTYPTNAHKAIAEAQAELWKLPDPDAGAVFISGRIITAADGTLLLDVEQAGDSCVLVTDKDGAIKFASVDESYVQQLVDEGVISDDEALYHKKRHAVVNYIDRQDGHVTRYKRVPLESGDRIYGYTDGIGDNLTPEEIVSFCMDLTPDEAMVLLSGLTDDRMMQAVQLKEETMNGSRKENGIYSDGFRSEAKRDNRGLVIVDIL